MIFKEETILIPLVLEIFNEDDWLKIAKDSGEYRLYDRETRNQVGTKRVDFNPSVSNEPSNEENDSMENANTSSEAELPFGKGYLTLNEVDKILDLLPLELTFINKDNVFKYFNDSIPNEDKAFPLVPPVRSVER